MSVWCILEEIRGRDPGKKSGVSSPFLPEKMNRHRIFRTPRKDEPTPDFPALEGKRDVTDIDRLRGDGVSGTCT